MQTTSQRTSAPAPEAFVSTGERIVRAASRMMQRQGYEGTGIKLIAREAGCTLSSVYHFFPGGKQEVAVAAIRHGDREFTEILRAGLAGAEDPAEAVEQCTRQLADALHDSDWTEGCPVIATALETLGRAPAIQLACSEALGHWQDVVKEKLTRAGVGESAARELAITVIGTLEGAEVTAQVFRSREPLLAAGRHLARLIRAYDT
jgi:AcrR family transcriptional regulator